MGGDLRPRVVAVGHSHAFVSFRRIKGATGERPLRDEDVEVVRVVQVGLHVRDDELLAVGVDLRQRSDPPNRRSRR
jgi:hypothetical protein